MQRTSTNAADFSGFKKRFLRSPAKALKGYATALSAILQMLFSSRKNRISRAFSERINLAVCGVNECLYCTHLHTKLALAKGIDGSQAAAIVNGDLDDVSIEEARALAYATRFAEEGGEFDRDAWDSLVESYGAGKARFIKSVVQVIQMGNMCSNTAEAFKRGIVKRTNPRFLFTYLIAAPVAFLVKAAGGYKEIQ